MKNILAITKFILGTFILAACLSTGQLLAQETKDKTTPLNEEVNKQSDKPKKETTGDSLPTFTPFGENDPNQPIDKKEALKQWEAQQQEAANSAKALRRGQPRGQQIIMRSSVTKVNRNGEEQTESSAKMVIIGPDGERKEIDITDDFDPALLNFRIPPNLMGGIAFNQPKPVAGFGVGLACWPVSEVLRSQLDLGDRGLVVLSVTQNSPAAKAGVEKHDILIFADDKELQDKKNLEEIVKLAGEEKQSFSLGLIRKGKEMTMDITPIEKSKLRRNQNIFQGGDFNMALPGQGREFPPMFAPPEAILEKVIQNAKRMEQAVEQFEKMNQELKK